MLLLRSSCFPVLSLSSLFISHLCSSKSNMGDKRDGFCLCGAHGLSLEKWLSRWQTGLAMDTCVIEAGWWYRVSKLRMRRWQAMVIVIFIHSSRHEKKVAETKRAENEEKPENEDPGVPNSSTWNLLCRQKVWMCCGSPEPSINGKGHRCGFYCSRSRVNPSI